MDVLHGCDDDVTIFFCLLSAGGLYELNAPMIQLTCYLPANTAPLWRTAARPKHIHNSFCPVTVTLNRLYKTPVEPKRRMKQVDACCLDYTGWVSQICSLTEGGGRQHHTSMFPLSLPSLMSSHWMSQASFRVTTRNWDSQEPNGIKCR